MSHMWRVFTVAAALYACSGNENAAELGSDAVSAGGSASESTDSRPLMGDGVTHDAEANGSTDSDSGGVSPLQGSFTSFTDAATGFATDEVHDADREVVHFDPSLGAMVWAATGDAVRGWTTSGDDLSWSRSGVAFRVRFGSEQGERRAYFTETGSGTICNLNISAPEQLSIFGTNEPPPQE